MHIFSDESWFPDQSLQTVCFLRWEKTDLDALRISVIKHQEMSGTGNLKRSKIRAKKNLLHATLDICEIVNTWQKKHHGGVMVFIWDNVSHLYTKWIECFYDRWNKNKQLISFFPDKNLTLQRHTRNHQFIHDKRFLHITPVTLRHEPLWVIPDLFAGMVREARQRPDLFSMDPVLISYKPDQYKVMIRQQWSSLLSSFQFYQA